MENFKREFSLEERKFQTNKIKEKHPDKIPVFVYKHKKSKDCDIQKNKFLIHQDFTLGQFVIVLRKQMKLCEDKGIFVFIDNILPPNAELMSSLYKKHSDDDGFLYVAFSHESVFG